MIAATKIVGAGNLEANAGKIVEDEHSCFNTSDEESSCSDDNKS